MKKSYKKYALSLVLMFVVLFVATGCTKESKYTEIPEVTVDTSNMQAFNGIGYKYYHPKDWRPTDNNMMGLFDDKGNSKGFYAYVEAENNISSNLDVTLDAAAKEMPASGFTNIQMNRTTIQGKKGAIIEFDQVLEKEEFHVIHGFVVSKRVGYTITVAVLKDQYEKNKDLAMQIVYSLEVE